MSINMSCTSPFSYPPWMQWHAAPINRHGCETSERLRRAHAAVLSVVTRPRTWLIQFCVLSILRTDLGLKRPPLISGPELESDTSRARRETEKKRRKMVLCTKEADWSSSVARFSKRCRSIMTGTSTTRSNVNTKHWKNERKWQYSAIKYLTKNKGALKCRRKESLKKKNK